MAAQLFQPHILRAIQQRLPDAGEFPQRVVKHLAVGSLRQIEIRDSQPLRVGFGHMIADIKGIKLPNGVHALEIGAEQAFVLHPHPFKFPGQPAVGPEQVKAEFPLIFISEPQAEAGLKIMIPGNLVVKAEALRPVAAQARGDAMDHIAEFRLQHGTAILLIIGLRQLQSLHG